MPYTNRNHKQQMREKCLKKKAPHLRKENVWSDMFSYWYFRLCFQKEPSAFVFFHPIQFHDFLLRLFSSGCNVFYLLTRCGSLSRTVSSVGKSRILNVKCICNIYNRACDAGENSHLIHIICQFSHFWFSCWVSMYLSTWCNRIGSQ